MYKSMLYRKKNIFFSRKNENPFSNQMECVNKYGKDVKTIIFMNTIPLFTSDVNGRFQHSLQFLSYSSGRIHKKCSSRLHLDFSFVCLFHLYSLFPLIIHLDFDTALFWVSRSILLLF